MQDRYAGDLGDFLKFGLLKQLATSSAGPPLRLGVVWYLVHDEGHNADGKHVTYFAPGSEAGAQLRALDPDLFRRLAHVVETERSIGMLETVQALPADALYFNDRLTFDGLTSAAAKLTFRSAWVARAVEAVAGANLVFVDPDNGLRRNDHKVSRTSIKAVKHTYYDELLPYLERGQSVVAYHHADRSAPVEMQAQRRMEEVRDQLGVEPLAVVRASRGTVRLFVLIPSERHRALLAERLAAIRSGPWRRELTVIDLVRASTPARFAESGGRPSSDAELPAPTGPAGVPGQPMGARCITVEVDRDALRGVMDRYGMQTESEAVDLALRRLLAQPISASDLLGTRGEDAIGEAPSDGGPTAPGHR